MIDFSKVKEARTRQDSVFVDGKEYPIRTEFCFWFSFDKKISAGGTINFDEFDFLYMPEREGGAGVPQDRVEGFNALHRFYLNEQPLPRPTGKTGRILFDFYLDSEYIYAAFFEKYHVNLLEEDLHWHDFLALFNALKDTCFNSIKEIRASKEKTLSDARRAWAITEFDIKKVKKYRKREELPVMGF